MNKIIITDLPWLKEDGTEHKFSARAGYRWGYTVDKEPIVSFRAYPFFLGYASALLKQEGYTITVLDALTENIPYLEFMARVKDVRADYLLTEVHTPSYNNDMAILKLIKKESPNIKIIVAGPHVTALPDDVLKENPFIDHVLIGEYEFLALHLIKNKLEDKKIDLPLLLKKKILKEESSIDELPWPDRESFNMLKYNETFCDQFPQIQILSSRGCPYSCSYCNCFLMSGRRIRYRNPHDVVEEMKYCIDKFHPREFWFEDDNINANDHKFRELMVAIHAANLNVPFKVMGHVNISYKALELFKMAGGNGIKLGIESVDDAVLKRLKKGSTFEMIKRTLAYCKELGIKTHLTYAIGLPGDTEETIKKTIDFAKKNGTQYQISIAAPFPGTPLYQESKENGWLNFNSWDDFNGLSDSIVSYPGLDNKTLYKLYLTGQDNTYKRIFLSGEWKKYLRMIYQERGFMGILKLFGRLDILKAVLKK